MFENFKVPSELRPSDPRFGVGPSLIPVQHVRNLADTGTSLLGTSHRRPAVRKVVQELQEGLKNYFKLPVGYEVVLGNGGATLLWDMIGLGLVEKSSLHFVTGEFSEKWYKAHAQIPWIKATEVKVAPGEGINAREEGAHDFICTTLNETSTGVMISALPTIKNEHTLLAIDATSGAGQIKVDWNKSDVYYFAPQKVFASDGGLYIAILSPKAIERALRIQQDKSRYIPEYMKWSHAIENSRQNQTYNTPSIATIFLMNEQVKLMNKLGEDKVISEAKRKADLMYGWAEEKSYLSPFIKEKSFRSQAVVTIDIDDKYNVDDLTKVLRAQNVAVDIEAYRKLNRNQLRIALFHNVAYDDLVKLTKIISLAIESHS
ncbi:MAG: aminotransferase class V-fold PLP-dependent enzyme [Bacteriovoracaceae bacterium]